MSGHPDANEIKHLDVFKEIGNIGAGNAASALAGVLNKKISMTVPEAAVVPFHTITNVMDGPETLVAGVLVDITGDLNGYILLLLGMKDAMSMVNVALGDAVEPSSGDSHDLTDLERDTIAEISNILVGSFLSAISSFTQLSVTPSVPQVAIDMLGAIISIATIEYGKIGDTVLFLETRFQEPAGEIAGHFFLIPDYKSYRILLDSLGLDS
jgi:chemotaxis protein CheC